MAFITDSGKPHTLKYKSQTLNIPRYGAWDYDHAKGKYQVCECSDNLEYLKTKYNVEVAINTKTGKPTK